MKHRFLNLVAGLGMAMFLAACGGGGGGGDDGGNVAPVTPPSAVATANPTSLNVGETVQLDASGSSSPRQGATLRYQWVIAERPEGSTAEVTNPQAARATFTPDRGGRYQIELHVNDGTAADIATLTIAVTNPNPVAIITPAEQSVILGATVTLDGSTSLPPTGQDPAGLHYEWELVEQPDGEPRIELQNTNSARAVFVAEKEGAYRATLRVSHGDKISPVAETRILVGVTNSAPVIKVTTPSIAVRGQRVLLDASQSFDPDGDTLHFRWRFPDALNHPGF